MIRAAKCSIKKVSGIGKAVVQEIVVKSVVFYRGKLTHKDVLKALGLGISRTIYNKWFKKLYTNITDLLFGKSMLYPSWLSGFCLHIS